MLKRLMASISATLRRCRARSRRSAFDPVYYLRRYPDLADLASAELAADHYRRHGEGEGRFPNALAEEETDYRKFLTDSKEFNLSAYKALNSDLVKMFSNDRDFVLHYIRHGRREKRRSSFGSENRIPRPRGLELFSVSQFSAWASDWIDPPQNCEEAIEQFQTTGIERLAPLRFDYEFDPTFYRSYYKITEPANDVDLYRAWLFDGQEKGYAPNEAKLLQPYLDDTPFPLCFDWSEYSREKSLSHNGVRATVLIHLFESENDWRSLKRYLSGGGSELRVVASLVQFKLRRNRAKDADAVLSTWDAEKDAWPAYLWSLRAAADVALGQTVAARYAYERAIASGDLTLRTVIDAVRNLMALNAFPEAFELLEGKRESWIGKTDFEQLLGEFADRLFERAGAGAHAKLAGIGDLKNEKEVVARVNEEMRQSLELIARSIEELELMPACLGPNPGGHVALLSNEDLPQCRHYRVEQRVEQLNAAGMDSRRHAVNDTEAFLRDLIGARAAIFYRVPATPSVVRAIVTARQMGIPTYYDIDDLIFCPENYPPPYETYQSSISLGDYRGLQFGVPLFRFAMGLCDRAISSTPPLLEQMLRVVREKEGFLLRNGLDSRNTSMIALGGRPPMELAPRIRIFYGSGTLAHNSDFSELVSPALSRLMDRDERIDLVFVGHVPQDGHLERHRSRILRYTFISDISEYWSVLSTCDINIAPLVPSLGTDCKSEIKWLEAAVLSVPTIASSTATYRDVITHRADGFIAETTEQWFEYLSVLANDPKLRWSIGHAARQKALNGYSLARSADHLKKSLSFVAGPDTPPRRLRVLVCNVFFYPQSIGGATRVVENNIEFINAHYPDIELAVLCTDEKESVPGRLRTSRFGDVPVFRVSVANRADLDLLAFDDKNITAFREVLVTFRPDLVHFHCIQRLTGSIVEECLKLGIPYLVTLHDAWWISQHQFLVDEDGLLRMPSPDLLSGFDGDPVTVGIVLKRRRLLEALLFGAKRVIAVSESFAEIYRAAGISTVSAISNGVSDLLAPLQPDGRRGRLRLALIGGRSSHKGADLVEAALRLGRYANLHLLLIDGRLAPGERIDTQWGETTVSITAPVPQSDIASLYRSIDVLLAPSRWPESFGLVAREAGHFGLWVIASRLGAMGEGIIEGENGFRVDTTDRRDLDRIFTTLNEQPDRFRQGTARRVPDQRTAHDQARELAEVYRSLSALR